MSNINGDIGEWIEVGGAVLKTGHLTLTIERLRFNRSLKGHLRAHGDTTAGKNVWIPLDNPPNWLASLICEISGPRESKRLDFMTESKKEATT